jgi:hypothetical protein
VKFVVFAVFEEGSNVDALLSRLHDEGYNGAYLPSKSFNSLYSSLSEEEPAVLSLGKALGKSRKDNPAFFSIINEKDFPPIRKAIEDFSGNFKKIRGALFMWPLTFFEGSFE